MLSWWLDADKVTRNFGNFISRDLSTMDPLQRYGALGLDLIAWCFLLMAVVQCWQFLTHWSASARC